MADEHDRVVELLGAHALDAAEDADQELVEHHVEVCADCRDELDHLRHVASLIGAQAAEGELPPHLWSRIESTIDPPANVVALAPRRGPLVAMTAVAAALMVLVGVQTARLDSARQDAARAEATIAAVALAVDSGDWAAVAELTDRLDGRSVDLAGDGTASVSLFPDGRGFVTAADLPGVDPGQAYQLWVVQRGEVVSAGLLRPGVVGSAFRYDPDTLDAIVVTREVAAGVVVAEGPAVAVWADA